MVRFSRSIEHFIIAKLTVWVWCSYNLIQKHPECKKRSGQELKKGQDEKELKSKWAAKAGIVLVLMRIKF